RIGTAINRHDSVSDWTTPNVLSVSFSCNAYDLCWIRYYIFDYCTSTMNQSARHTASTLSSRKTKTGYLEMIRLIIYHVLRNRKPFKKNIGNP
ncbi:MAG: hypothetical protein ACI8RD_011984, partial [Bacillariaceae sp.]